jgi:uncharacterized protein
MAAADSKQIMKAVSQQRFARARGYAEKRLGQELSPHLLYHGLAHTRDEVVPAAERLAGMEGLHGESLHLLLTAAWFHDLGYVEQAVHHELIGARMAVEALPSFGYREDQVETVRWAILATALPQSPGNLLEEILVDSDMYVLGGENFMQRNHDLRMELEFLGKRFTDQQWYEGQLKFVERHTYFTASARSLRDARKARNIVQLRGVVEGLGDGKECL